MLSDIDQAIEANDLEGVKRAVAAGADLRHMGDYDATPLANAAARGHVEIVQCLLDAGADPDYGGCSSIMTEACGSGNFAVCEILLRAGADPNSQDSECRSGIGVTIFKARRQILELLVRYGATVALLDEHLQYAMQLNKDGSHDDVIDYLQELKGD